MKEDFLVLIDRIDYLKNLFTVNSGVKTINSNVEFSVWKKELQFELEEIYKDTNDTYIWSTLNLLKQGFGGWNDEITFSELNGSLLAIKKNINKFYKTGVLNDISLKTEVEEVKVSNSKKSKLFISHSSQDIALVNILVELLEGIGMNHENLFCSSVPGYGIPLNEDIYDYLKSQFYQYNLHVLYILSENYYNSPACLNEMGAAWILKSKETTILAPTFDYKEIKGAINPRKIGLKLDEDITVVKEHLGVLKNDLVQEFNLNDLNGTRWELKRDKFILNIENLNYGKPPVRVLL